MKADHPTLLGIQARGSYETLTKSQKLLCDLFITHYAAYLAGQCPSALHVNLDGEGGTGKTHVIEFISVSLDEMWCNGPGNGQTIVQSPVLRCAPTGVAAHNISGKTLHSLFRIPVSKGEMADLDTSALQSLQAIFAGVIYLIVDEKSMVSLSLLARIHKRCVKIFPRTANLAFGGLNILLAGDFFQLPPVAARPLFSTKKSRIQDEIIGQQYYKIFRHTIVLDVYCSS